MNAPPTVRDARADESAAVARVLTDAFVDEDGLNYWLKQGAAKTRSRRTFFDAAVRDVVHPARRIEVAEADGALAGAAIWLKPGDKAFDLPPLRQLMLTPLLLRVAGVQGMQRATALGRQLTALHPHVPHAHLVFLGVAPAMQGRGVGSAMLKHALAPLDAAGLHAYLEASTERNIALYERHGFVVTGAFELPGLHMRTMLRAPR
ncbi:MAG: GNAT family N-acetyltransferase [Hyphomonadaceae bacterium]